jgi:fatty acid desaturase
MHRRLLGFALWLAIALSLVGLFNFFQNAGRPSAPPQDLAHWLLAFLISWSPFFFLVGVWIVIALWMRHTAGLKETPVSAKTLDDPAHWRDCAGRSRVIRTIRRPRIAAADA